ncbi:MAG: GNAT family N-acetyltransferase [Planctomycetota bacterium]
MSKTPELIPLAEHDHALATVAAAFADHPLTPRDQPGEPKGTRTRRMMGMLFKSFAKASDLHWFGIRGDDGRLQCFAMVYAYGYEPPKRQMAGMVWTMVRMLGLRKAWAYMRVMSQKHPGGGRRLELQLLATRPDAQGKGLGRVMLRFLYDWASERGYDAVILETAKDTPAFGFYGREGFEVTQELTVPDGVLCYMRRELGTTSKGGT